MMTFGGHSAQFTIAIEVSVVQRLAHKADVVEWGSSLECRRAGDFLVVSWATVLSCHDRPVHLARTERLTFCC